MGTNALSDIQLDLWADTTVEISREVSKSDIPALPKIAGQYQTVLGKGGALAFLALQILKSDDKELLMRVMASATAILLNDDFNYTGSTLKPVELTGLDTARDDTLAETTKLNTNLLDAEDVTIGELRAVMQFDTDELGAYFGLLYVAGNKKLTAQNRAAFNENRAGAATAGVIGDPQIFKPESVFLEDTIVQKLYAAFYSCAPLRANMTDRAASRMGGVMMGPTGAFASMFLLLNDSGLGWLRIIKEATIKYPWVRTKFPALQVEFTAANNAQRVIRKAPAYQRPFLKAIFGNSFVPITSGQVGNLFGVCKLVMSFTVPTYRNYNGGHLTDEQRDVIQKMFQVEPDTPRETETEDAVE